MKHLSIWNLSMAIFILPELLVARSATTTVRIPPVSLEVQIVLGEGEMTRATMVRESEAILDRHKDTAFIKIQFSESQGTMNIPSILPDGVLNRGIWAFMKKRWNGMSLRYGELISIRGNAVLRIRDGFELQTILIRGENPLVVSYKGRSVEFVHFGMFYNDSKTSVLWIDASAVVQNGGLDAELAKSVVRAAQRALDSSLRANLTMGEDRFYFFTPMFAHSLLFDLDAPPESGEWYKIRRAECSVNRFGNGHCVADRPTPGSREHIEF